MKKTSALILTLLLITGLLMGCNNSSITEEAPDAKTEVKTEDQKEEKSAVVQEETQLNTKAEGEYPVTIYNFDSKRNIIEQTFKEAPKNVVVTNGTTAEILLELGLKDHIVAVPETTIMEKYREDYETIEKLPNKYNLEAVLGQSPDFVTGWYSFFNDENTEDVTYWNEKGVHTFIQRNTGGEVTRDINYLFWDILDYGRIFHVEEKANEIVLDMQHQIHDLSLKISDYNAEKYKTYDEKPGVMVIEIANEGEYRLYGQKALAHSMLVSLNIKDVTDGYGYGYRDEHLIERNPDVLFVVYFENSQTPEENVEKIYENPGLQNIEAVKNKRVYPIPLGQMYGGGMRTMEGFENFAHNTYPELFE